MVAWAVGQPHWEHVLRDPDAWPEFSPKEISTTEFPPKESSSNGIFAGRNVRRMEISPNGISAVGNFAERNFRQKL